MGPSARLGIAPVSRNFTRPSNTKRGSFSHTSPSLPRLQFCSALHPRHETRWAEGQSPASRAGACGATPLRTRPAPSRAFTRPFNAGQEAAPRSPAGLAGAPCGEAGRAQAGDPPPGPAQPGLAARCSPAAAERGSGSRRRSAPPSSGGVGRVPSPLPAACPPPLGVAHPSFVPVSTPPGVSHLPPPRPRSRSLFQAPGECAGWTRGEETYVGREGMISAAGLRSSHLSSPLSSHSLVVFSLAWELGHCEEDRRK